MHAFLKVMRTIQNTLRPVTNVSVNKTNKTLFGRRDIHCRPMVLRCVPSGLRCPCLWRLCLGVFRLGLFLVAAGLCPVCALFSFVVGTAGVVVVAGVVLRQVFGGTAWKMDCARSEFIALSVSLCLCLSVCLCLSLSLCLCLSPSPPPPPICIAIYALTCLLSSSK